MLKALAELGQGHDGHELPRSHANQLCHQHDDRVMDHVVEQVIAVVAPHRHLALRVVHGMQLPPPGKTVLTAMNPVLDQIEDHQIHQQADPRIVRHARPKIVKVKARQTPDMELAHERIPQRLRREEQGQPEKSQPMNQRVEDVHTNRLAVDHGLDRPPALQRHDHCDHDRYLQ